MSDEKIYSNLQQIALKDEVYVDDNGMLGTQYPLGSYQFPVLTLAQARVISAERNIVSIRLRGSHNIDAAMERYNFKGYAHLDITDLVSFNGQDVDGSSFMDLVLTGAQGGTGYIYARDCVLINATSLRGVFNHTKLVTAIGLATGGVADNVDFVECYSLMGGITVTVNSPDLVNFYGWRGSMTLQTMGGGTVNIWAADGAVITIAASCVGGTINIYGDCRVINNSGGAVVNNYATNHDFQEQPDTAVNITAIAGGETDVFDLNVANTRYIVRNLRLKCADPGANTVTVRLRELVNDVSTIVNTFDITAANFAGYHSLMDMFGVPYLAGDDLQVTVQASGGGPFAVTGQYAHATAT